MKRSLLGGALGRVLAAAMAALTSVSYVHATPYATGVTNTGSSISFRLNEAADDVKIISGTTTNNAGPLPAGVFTTNLTLTGTVSIQVSKTGGGAITQISGDQSTMRFSFSRGFAVNSNPKSPYFGRIYVGNATAGTTVSVGGVTRTTGDGIYLINPDFTDAVGQGDTVRTGGLNFGTGGSSSPYRMTVGMDDDNLYITDWADADGNLFVVGPNVETNSTVTNVLSAIVSGGAAAPVGLNANHGSVEAAIVKGTLAGGDLTVWTLDEDLETDRTVAGATQFNSLWRYDIGAETNALPYTNFLANLVGTAPINFVSQTMDLAAGANGFFYMLNNRSAGNEPIVTVFDSGNNNANKIFNTRSASIATLGLTFDYCSNGVAVAVSPDQKFMAVVRLNNNVVVFPLVDGLPDFNSIITFNAFSITAGGRGIAFDAADNLYVINNSASAGGQLLRCFTLGLTTTATTTSDGTPGNTTFSLVTPSTKVAVTTDNNTAYEAGPQATTFILQRSNDDLSQDLKVVFKMTGTASNGVDYVLQTNGVTLTTNVVTIPAFTDTIYVTLTPIDDAISEAVETATLTVNGSAVYSPGVPSFATTAVIDNDTPEISLSTIASTCYEAVSADYLTFQITRKGETNIDATVNIAYTGTAVNGVDYTNAMTTVTVDPGAVTVNFHAMNPIDNTSLDGNRTVIATVQAGTGYKLAATGLSGTGTILDDEYPATQVLFSDSLATDTSANYKFFFAANNLIDDYRLNFGYDPTFDGVAPPPNGMTNVLMMTVNKDEGSANGAAAINLYPIGQSFSGNYAVRFQMNLVQNDGASTSEQALFGINHSSTKTNWIVESGDLVNNIPKDQDGLWYGVFSDASAVAPGDYSLVSFGGVNAGPALLTSAAATSFTQVFKNPPYTPGGGSGAPGNIHGSSSSTWTDVEIRKLGNVVRLSMNKTPIITYTNTTAYTNGDIMLGYCDPYASVGATGGAVYYSNLRVVAVPSPLITSVVKSGTNINLTFTDGNNDPASSYFVYGSSLVGGTYTNMSATITQTAVSTYTTSVPYVATNSAKFFRILHR